MFVKREAAMDHAAWLARSKGNAFDDADVAKAYDFRPPYAPAMYDVLLGLVPRRRAMIDLGCGPGKIAAALADKFESVVGVDASGPMIARAAELYPLPNVRWMHAPAEDVPLPDPLDLATAGASIHWMKHDVLFPKLAARGALVAIVSGDGPPAPPWQEDEARFLTKWLARIGLTYDRTRFVADGRKYEAWMDVTGRREFRFSFRQSVADYVECQHSRATFTRARMGEEIAAAFDAELTTVLASYARGGMIEYELVTDLTWGTARETAQT
jgi:SAM-dependent methyltransferase